MTDVLAGVVLAVCLFLALRLAAGDRRRQRFDRWFQAAFAATLTRIRRTRKWRTARQASAREAEAVIRRAHGGKWDGNVYRPRSFRRPRKPH